MLIEFSVGNFRSIKEIQTLNFVATSIKELEESNTFEALPKLRLLKSAGLYGANASGKSNLIKALNAMQLILNKNLQQPNIILYHQFFEFDITMKLKPTFLQIIFIIKGKKYRYGFEYHSQKIISEWLFGTAAKNEVYYFTRDNQEIKVNEKYFKEGKGFEKNVTGKNLFLSVLSFLNGEIARKIIDFLGESIYLITDTQEQINLIKNYATKSLESNEDFTSFLNLLLQFSDTGIKSIGKMKISNVDNALSQRIVYDEKGNKLLKNFVLDDFESEGTKKLFNYSLNIYDALITGGTLIIDEFDARFHPLLTRKIVQLFNSKANKNNAQLFFATHDTNLLDRELLRRDQIYFAEKDNEGATHIYSLADFKGVRNDASYEKDYIKGKYGAIPFLGDFEQLISNADETTQKN